MPEIFNNLIVFFIFLSVLFSCFFPSSFYSDVYYNEGSSESQLLCDDSPVMVQTKDFNQLCESSGYYYLQATSKSPFAQHIQLADAAAESCGERTSMKSSHKTVVSAKKYTFNPLSEPFHPMRNIYSDTSSPSSVTSDSSECSSNASTTSTSESTKTTLIETKKFVCILCPEKYNTLDELKHHLESKVQQPYSCVICGISFAHNYLLQRHTKQHRSLKSFRCRCCNKKFRSLNLLGKHFEFCRYKLYMFI